MIDGHTQLVGLMGWPVGHSLSPVMHNAVFEALGLNWCYVPVPVPPGQVETAVKGLAALGFRGANVTVPHKEAVLRAAGSVSPTAGALGAVNTLVMKRDYRGIVTICGENTDVEGFVGALREGGFRPEDCGHAVVVGAGGAARSAVHGLLRLGCGKITVLNRNVERALALREAVGGDPSWPEMMDVLPLSAEVLVESARRADLLVNATTLGMWPETGDSIWPEDAAIPRHLTVFDLVYNPLETRLLAQARAAGAQAMDGLGMLVRQGALAFELWTNQGLDVQYVSKLMRAACESILGR